MLKKFGMESSKTYDTPIPTSAKLDSLLYITVSRPDIIFSVDLCARFQYNLNESHLLAVKRILRYLKGIEDLCLWYPSGASFDLMGYADADFAGYHVDRKSTSVWLSCYCCLQHCSRSKGFGTCLHERMKLLADFEQY
ncbi:hypothetical protein Dimus_039033 [Dionaea muscipula]